MKLGIVSPAYFGAGEDMEGLRRMKRHGYDYMDYNHLSDIGISLYHCDEATFTAQLTATRQKIHSAGIAVSQTHAPWRWPAKDRTAEERADWFDKMVTAIRATALLESTCFVVHPLMPFGEENPEPDWFWELNRDFLTRLTAVGEAHGVIVCLENMPMKKLTLSAPADTLRMVKEINLPYLRVCLDTGHSLVMGVQPGEAVRQIGREYLACLHVHDNDGVHDLHQIPYAGKADWPDFAAALREIGYTGVFSLETDVSHVLHVPVPLREPFEIGIANVAKTLAAEP